MSLFKPTFAPSWRSSLLPPLLALLFLLLLVLPGLAQTPVFNTQIEMDFPQAITFRLEAEAPAEINRVVLRYQIDRIACFEEVVDRYPDFTPGQRVEASWTWQLRRVGGLPPGAGISYQWIIRSVQGEEWQSPLGYFKFEDPGHTWQRLAQDKISLYWYLGDENFARQLLEAAQGSLGRLQGEIRVALEKEVSLYIYESAAALQVARVYPQEWEGGVAFPDYGILAIGISPNNLGWGKRALAHELAHLLVYQATFNCFGSLPTWLNEGLAMYSEGSLSPEMESRLKSAIAENSLISVPTLASSFPSTTEEALLSYAESFSLVKFLLDQFGGEKIQQLLLTFKQGSGYDEALLQVYGFDMTGLDVQWRQYIGAPPHPSPEVTPTPTPVPSPVPTPPQVATPPLPTVSPTPPPTPAPVQVATPSPTPSPQRGGLSCALGRSSNPGYDLGALLLGVMWGSVFFRALSYNKRRKR